MRIKEIEMLSHDLVQTEKFYSGILGLPVDQKNDFLLSYTVGDSRLVFTKTDIEKPVYHFAFNIPHNKLHEAETWLSSRVTPIQFQDANIIDFKNWNAKSIYFLDNNGNVLEFIARFGIDNKSNTPFDGSSILSISEIAFVTDHVEKLANELMEHYGFTYFGKQIQRQDFSALGEDHGLLILVSSERNWFPTSIRAEQFPTKVIIENHNKTIEFEYR